MTQARRTPRPPVRYENGKYDGKTLREWMPIAVDDVVRALDPQRVIVFGSVARNEEGPDSDLDLLVILDEVPREKKRDLMTAARAAVTAPIPIDVFVTDPVEYERRKDVIGSMHYWPARQGEVVYERSA